MVRNEEIYKQALIFRKRGFTYEEIAKICGVSKSTVAHWCRGKRFSKQVAKDNASRAAKENAKRVGLLQKARQAERKHTYLAAETAARTEFKHYCTNPLFIAGVMLYAASGDRKDMSRIRLTTNQMDLHRIFITFLQEYLGVPKVNIQFWLLLYQDQDQKKLTQQWAKRIKLPASQFGKTQVISQTSKGLHAGTGNTIIGNTVLKRKLSVWVDLALKEL